MAYLTSKQFSQNTFKKILSVVKLFKLWETNKNKNLRMSTVPTKPIEEWSCDELCTWLPVFICEARKIGGGYYKAKTLMKYVLMLQCHCQAHGVIHRFLSDVKFIAIKNCLENVMKDRQKKGLG